MMRWDVPNGGGPWPMTNVRNLAVPRWKRLAEKPANRCLVPLTECCESTPHKFDLRDGNDPIKSEMCFK